MNQDLEDPPDRPVLLVKIATLCDHLVIKLTKSFMALRGDKSFSM